MLVSIKDGIEARVLEGEMLPIIPSWEFRVLTAHVSMATSQRTYGEHYAQTIGAYRVISAYLFRFDKTNGTLKSIMLPAPTTMTTSQIVFDTWLAQLPVNGLLQLTEPVNFQIMELEMDYGMDREGKAFICSTALSTESGGNKLRLRIAQDFDLLFDDEQFCGWILNDPVRYIVSLWDTPHDYQPDNQLVDIVYDYLQLVSVPSFDRVDDENPEILKEFLDLRALLMEDKSPGYQRRVVRAAIEDILDFFYDDWRK